MSPLTPREYAFANTPKLCAAMGLEWNGKGWGFLFCEDESGVHWTAATSDAEYVRALADAVGKGVLSNLEIPQDKFSLKAFGWPDEWDWEADEWDWVPLAPP